MESMYACNILENTTQNPILLFLQHSYKQLEALGLLQLIASEVHNISRVFTNIYPDLFRLQRGPR